MIEHHMAPAASSAFMNSAAEGVADVCATVAADGAAFEVDLVMKGFGGRSPANVLRFALAMEAEPSFKALRRCCFAATNFGSTFGAVLASTVMIPNIGAFGPFAAKADSGWAAKATARARAPALGASCERGFVPNRWTTAGGNLNCSAEAPSRSSSATASERPSIF